MTPAHFQYLCSFLKRRAGLVLSAEKTYLAESRLSPIARHLGYASLDALAETLKAGRSPTLESAVIEAMVTNETSFFRDKIPFDRLRNVILPRLIGARASVKRLNIWCTAASTGQEPYSIAMVVKELEAQLRGWRIEILATDISASVLEKARSGIYSQFEVQRGLPIQQLVRNFTQEGETWRIGADLRAMVRYRELNLLDNFASLGTFDVVFCRNVLIYLDRDTKIDILGRLARSIASDGYLVLGAAETVIGLTDALRVMPDERGFYELESDVASTKLKLASA
jgi:chemotaxis protein methyltransferase CheR